MRTSSSKVPTGRIARWVLPAPLLALAACGGGAGGPSPDYRPTIAQPAPPAAANGAIYQASQGYAPLTTGTRAAAVGDILTIVLMERTQASNENSATTERGGSIGLTPPASGPLAVLGGDLNLGGDQSFSGRGQSTQSNRLSGEISVTIAEVYPNGTMLVRGEKLVRLNRGDEFIRISGLVRPSDISLDNRIASSRVADAQIVYSGRGELARASAQGWLQRFFSRVSPF